MTERGPKTKGHVRNLTGDGSSEKATWERDFRAAYREAEIRRHEAELGNEQ